MGELKVWRNSVVDWYIARSPEHCRELQAEIAGTYNPDDLSPLDDWQLETRPTLTIQEYGDNGETLTLTLDEWVQKHGAGMLGSTEW